MMKVYSIEQWHDGLLNGTIDVSLYYQQLQKEALFQQKRLNALTTICFQTPPQDLIFNSLLAGVPYVLKDNICTYQIPTTASSRMLKDFIPVYDAHVVQRLKQENACLIGKASMDELSMGSTNMTALTGPVYNPWDTKRIAGGSSGGSASLVASGLVPFALGTDTGDSIRRPAGFCGVIGMKPTWGLISRYGIIPYAASLDAVGVLTRSVQDLSIVLEKIAGYDFHDMTSSRLSIPHYRQNLSLDISNVKVAIIQNIVDILEDDRIKTLFQNCVSLLKKAGATVHNITFSQTYLEAIFPVYQIIANSEATSHHASLDGIKYGFQSQGQNLEEMIVHTRSQGFHPNIQQRFILGSLALKQENQEKMFKKAQKVRRLIVEDIQKILKTYDIVMIPNGDGIAPLIEEAKSQSHTLVDDFLIIANLAGLPSLTLPCGFVDDMPVAVNLMGRCFDEQTVLNCAYTLESMMPYCRQYAKGEQNDV